MMLSCISGHPIARCLKLGCRIAIRRRSGFGGRRLSWRRSRASARTALFGALENPSRAYGIGRNAISPTAWKGLAHDKTRPSGIAPLADDVRRAVLTKTACETPRAETHWSGANMACAIGISASSLERIWAEAGLKTHQSETPPWL